eukprot:TRINITY_DN9134_c0_g3_i4.p1 TRINITY_DN9134_c0_g3~~TRINITY_DN9134_c0_g3_i4.p1  ORF type:complete len:507 (-),score=86.72 TRINITY_DN9134_c0_g3_i4:117-1637(-)
MEDWVVERILSAQTTNTLEYLVKWEGYAARHNSWVTYEELLDLPGGEIALLDYETTKRNKFVKSQEPKGFRRPLPELCMDVWTCVTRKLHGSDLANFSRVCKTTWEYYGNLQCSFLPNLARHVNNDNIAHFLGHYSPSDLRRLVLRGTQVGDECLNLLKEYKQLRFLDLQYVRLSIDSQMELIRSLPLLEEVVVSSTALANNLVKSRSQFPRLSSIQCYSQDGEKLINSEFLTGKRISTYPIQLEGDYLNTLICDGNGSQTFSVVGLKNLERLELNRVRAVGIEKLSHLRKLSCDYTFVELFQLAKQLTVLHVNPLSGPTFCHLVLESDTIVECTWSTSFVRLPNCVKFKACDVTHLMYYNLPQVSHLEISEASWSIRMEDLKCLNFPFVKRLECHTFQFPSLSWSWNCLAYFSAITPLGYDDVASLVTRAPNLVTLKISIFVTSDHVMKNSMIMLGRLRFLRYFLFGVFVGGCTGASVMNLLQKHIFTLPSIKYVEVDKQIYRFF